MKEVTSHVKERFREAGGKRFILVPSMYTKYVYKLWYTFVHEVKVTYSKPMYSLISVICRAFSFQRMKLIQMSRHLIWRSPLKIVEGQIIRINEQTIYFCIQIYVSAANWRRCFAKSQKKWEASSYLFSATAFIANVLSTRSASSVQPASWNAAIRWVKLWL